MGLDGCKTHDTNEFNFSYNKTVLRLIKRVGLWDVFLVFRESNSPKNLTSFFVALITNVYSVGARRF